MLLRYNTCPRCGHFPETRPELKINKYPDQLRELAECFMDDIHNSPLFWDDKTKFASSSARKNGKLSKLFKKYNLDNSCKDLYIWEVVEKMYNYRPF